MNVCNCPHHKMMSVLVVVFGLLFLLGNLSILSMNTVNIAWPVIVIIAGLHKMSRSMCKCCGHDTISK